VLPPAAPAMLARRWRRSTGRSRTDPSAAAAAVVDCVGIRSLAVPSAVTWSLPDSAKSKALPCCRCQSAFKFCIRMTPNRTFLALPSFPLLLRFERRLGSRQRSRALPWATAGHKLPARPTEADGFLTRLLLCLGFLGRDRRPGGLSRQPLGLEPLPVGRKCLLCNLVLSHCLFGIDFA